MYHFTLIHYTEGWHTGASVTLSAIPVAGTLVKATSNAPESYADIYYIDNILWSDGGDNYLFVRPYDGYGESAPLTEADRIKAAMDETVAAIDNLTDNIMERLADL